MANSVNTKDFFMLFLCILVTCFRSTNCLQQITWNCVMAWRNDAKAKEHTPTNSNGNEFTSSSEEYVCESEKVIAKVARMYV